MAQDGKRSRRIASLAGTVELRAVAGGEEHPKEPLRLQHAQRVRYLLEPEGELLSERDGRPPMAYADDQHTTGERLLVDSLELAGHFGARNSEKDALEIALTVRPLLPGNPSVIGQH